MYIRSILLFASIILPIIGAPVATTDVPLIEERAVTVASQPRSYIPKREAVIDSVATKAFEDVVFETKRDAGAVDVRDIEEGNPSIDEDEDEVKDDGNNHETRGVRGGSGNNSRGVRPGSGSNPRGVRPGSGNNPRGVRPGSGNNPRGVRGGNGNNHKSRGVRPGRGNNPRGVRQGNGNNHKTRGIQGTEANPRSSLLQRALEALFS